MKVAGSARDLTPNSPFQKPGFLTSAGFLSVKSVKNAALLEVEDSETRLF
jgi:hypothetical protein